MTDHKSSQVSSGARSAGDPTPAGEGCREPSGANDLRFDETGWSLPDGTLAHDMEGRWYRYEVRAGEGTWRLISRTLREALQGPE